MMELVKRSRTVGRRMIMLLFLLSLIVGWMVQGSQGVYAATPIATDQTMKLDGTALKSDVPVYVESDRALVPARVIFEGVGGNVTWDGDTQRVTILYGGSKVELTIDGTTAYVDGKATALDVPARLVIVDKNTGAGRTMIPVRFVSESLKFGVNYDDSTRIISLSSPVKETVDTRAKLVSVDCMREPAGRLVVVKTTEPIASYSDFKLDGPLRYVVDVKKVDMQANVPESIPVADEKSPMSAIRVGQFDTDTLRVALDLSQEGSPTVELSKDKRTLTIRVPDRIGGGEQVIPSNPSAPPVPPTLSDSDVSEPISKKPASLADVLIVIDPGHGGAYPGSLGKVNGKTVLYEKEPNLDIALRLNQKLQAAGLRTMMTHDTDSLCDKDATTAAEDLLSRSVFANENKATLFISTHNNSADNVPNAKGTETLYNETEGKAAYGISGKELATLVQKKMIAYCGTANRGVKSQPDLSVLRRTEMPAIIIEGAFMSNESDLNLLMTDAFRENYARAVAEATIEYLNSIFK